MGRATRLKGKSNIDEANAKTSQAKGYRQASQCNDSLEICWGRTLVKGSKWILIFSWDDFSISSCPQVYDYRKQLTVFTHLIFDPRRLYYVLFWLIPILVTR